jgi:hypothetical protein
MCHQELLTKNEALTVLTLPGKKLWQNLKLTEIGAPLASKTLKRNKN